MKYLLLLFVFLSTTNAQTIEDYEKQIDAIKDEKLKEELRKKIAQKIADDMTAKAKEKQESNSSVQVHDETKKSSSEMNRRNELNFVLGINSALVDLKVKSDNLLLSGGEFVIGAAKYHQKHRMRYLFTYKSYKLNEIIDANGKSYKYSNLSDKISYSGSGAKIAYTYFTSRSFGIGGYVDILSGKAKICSDYENCKQEDARSFDFGGRIDLKISSWTPFLQLGRVYYKGKSEKYDGLSFGLGLFNIEI